MIAIRESQVHEMIAKSGLRLEVREHSDVKYHIVRNDSIIHSGSTITCYYFLLGYIERASNG